MPYIAWWTGYRVVGVLKVASRAVLALANSRNVAVRHSLGRDSADVLDYFGVFPSQFCG